MASDQTTIRKPCSLDRFASEVAAAPGVGLGDLEALTILRVQTSNSLYRVVVVEPSRQRIMIQGGDYFPTLTEARLCGASHGGSMLKVSWLGCGLRMELSLNNQRIVTSPVRWIEVERGSARPC